MSNWIPPSQRDLPPTALALVAGVPDYLFASLLDWLNYRLHDEKAVFREEMIRTFERLSRRRVAGPGAIDFEEVADDCEKNPLLLLDLVAFVVEESYWPSDDDIFLDDLEEMLEQGGSEWRVSRRTRDGRIHAKLEKRVRAEIRIAKERVVSGADRAGAHIKAAWGLVYGRSPKPNDAYREAVVAVEAAAVPVVSPKNSKATLGTMIADLKNSPAKFSVALRPIDSIVVSFDVALGMCQLLWKSQPSRHGTPTANPHSTVSQKEAEAAVHLAILLVHWFTTGVIVRS